MSWYSFAGAVNKRTAAAVAAGAAAGFLIPSLAAVHGKPAAVTEEERKAKATLGGYGVVAAAAFLAYSTGHKDMGMGLVGGGLLSLFGQPIGLTDQATKLLTPGK